jgi:hypothetical protein
MVISLFSNWNKSSTYSIGYGAPNKNPLASGPITTSTFLSFKCSATLSTEYLKALLSFKIVVTSLKLIPSFGNPSIF